MNNLIGRTQIWLVRIEEVHANLTKSQIAAWRIAVDSQDDAMSAGRRMWTEWMHQNPNRFTTLTVSQPSFAELGIQ
jgi:hypothetical protein